jgi:imidazolonepropionase-like amidohydrolase
VVQELERLIAAGLSPEQALSAATQGSARVLNLHDALGKLAAGYRADVLIVDGSPDRDPRALYRVQTVILDGIVQHPSPAGILDAALALWHIVQAKLWG